MSCSLRLSAQRLGQPPHFAWIRIARGELSMGAQSGKGCAKLVCSVTDELLLRRKRPVQPGEEGVQRLHQRSHLLRYAALGDRVEIGRAALLDLAAKLLEGSKTAADAEPEEDHGGEYDDDLRNHRTDQHLAHERGSLDLCLSHLNHELTVGARDI